MIEMVYKGKDGSGSGEKKLPKNVRQIGEAGKGKKIYLEDYAVTYLHQSEAAVLVGEKWEKDGGRYIFIHGAIQVDDKDFSDDIWEGVYRDAREYFPESEILGWAMKAAEQPEASDEQLNRIFKTHFDREDAVLLVYEEAEKEDTVFAEENGALKKVGGYFIYYDKNKSMQDYMISKNEGKSVEKEPESADKAIRSFRKKSEEKKEHRAADKEPAGQPRSIRFLYVASTFLVLTIMVIAVTMISNYDKMKTMEQALSNMADATDVAAEVSGPALETGAEVSDTETFGSTRGETDGTENAVDTETSEMTEETQSESSAETDVAQSETAQTEAAASAGSEASLASAGETQASSPDVAAAQTEAVSAAARPQQASYTVKAGDTLMDICRMYYGTDDRLEELCAYNGITDPNSIIPGQNIKLP